jgi:hypothetical protein
VTDHRVPGASVLGGVERVLSGDMLGELMDAVAALRREEALDALLEEGAKRRGEGPAGEREGAAAAAAAAGGG